MDEFQTVATLRALLRLRSPALPLVLDEAGKDVLHLPEVHILQTPTVALRLSLPRRRQAVSKSSSTDRNSAHPQQDMAS